MRILHVSGRLTDRGGAHWHLRAVIERLRGLGHDLHLAVGGVDTSAEPPCPVTVVQGLDARTREETGGLDDVVRSFRPAVVHLHTVVNPAVLERASSQPALITVQDHRYFCPGQGKLTSAGEVCHEPMHPRACEACFEDEGYSGAMRAVTEERLRALCRLRVVVLSCYMKAELVAAGVPAAQVSVIPPFVHGLHAAEPAAGPPCVLYAGRLAAAKGVRDAVAAWRIADLGSPLVFAGTGPLRAELEEAGHTVLGWVSHAALGPLYRRARALIFSPRWQEPFGMVGLEALAMGTPVAAWRSGGIAEWHPGQPPLAAWGDVAGLGAALRAAALGPRAAAPDGFDPAELMDRLVGVYGAVRGRAAG